MWCVMYVMIDVLFCEEDCTKNNLLICSLPSFCTTEVSFWGEGVIIHYQGIHNINAVQTVTRNNRTWTKQRTSEERANETRQDTKRSQIIVMFLRSYSRSNYSMMWYVVIIINVDLFHCNQSMGKIAYQNIPMMVNHCYHHRCCCCCCCCCRCVQD